MCFLDDEFSAKLKITKQDDETKKTVLAAGTEFKIYDMDNEKYVEQVTTIRLLLYINPILPMLMDI